MKENEKEKERKNVTATIEIEQGIEIATGTGSIKNLSGIGSGIINTFSSSIDSIYMVVAGLLHLKDQVWSHIIMSCLLITIIAHHHITTMSSTTINPIHRLPYHQVLLQLFIVQGRLGTMIIIVLLHSYIQLRVNRILRKSSRFLRATNLLLSILEIEIESRGLGKVRMSSIIIQHHLHLSTANGII